MSFTVRRLRNILRPGNRFLQRLTVSFMGFSHSFFHHHNRLSQRASPPQRGTTTIYQMSTFSLGFLSPTPLFLFFDRTAVIHDDFFFSCSPSVLSMSSRRGIPHLPFILIFLFFNWSRVGIFVFWDEGGLCRRTHSRCCWFWLVSRSPTIFLPFLGYLSWGTLKTPHDDDDTPRAYGRHTRHRFSLPLYLVSNLVFFSSTSISLPLND